MTPTAPFRFNPHLKGRAIMETETTPPTIGTVSHGTMRPADLIPKFLDTLAEISPGDCESILEDRLPGLPESGTDQYWQSMEADALLSDLFEALNDHAPALCYFGSLEGDGADYGFWIDHEQIDSDEDVLKVSDLAEIPDDHADYVVVINDHGNMTLYRPAREWREVWSVV
jgi:hypothetical protein